jgi:hypothetical protein
MPGEKIGTKKQRKAAKKALESWAKHKKNPKGGWNAENRMKKEKNKKGESKGYAPYGATEKIKYKGPNKYRK